MPAPSVMVINQEKNLQGTYQGGLFWTAKFFLKMRRIYTPEIAMEAGDAFWEIQPAYRKRAKIFRLGAELVVTFALLAILVARENGFGIVSVGALVMAAIALVGFIKGEQLVKGSAKNLQAMNTRVNYG